MLLLGFEWECQEEELVGPKEVQMDLLHLTLSEEEDKGGGGLGPTEPARKVGRNG